MKYLETSLNFSGYNAAPVYTGNSRTTNLATNDATESSENSSDNRNLRDFHFKDSAPKTMGVEMMANSFTRPHAFSEPVFDRTKPTDGATCILPHLYLGSQKDVVDKNMMESYGITYVLNVSKTCTQPSFIDNEHFHRISVRDNMRENMTPYIKEAITFIEKVRKLNQRVLVHCLAGVSRSATVAIAYVIYHQKMNFEDSYKFVKDRRPSISPNFNFLGQLMEFEGKLQREGHMTLCKKNDVINKDSCKCAQTLTNNNTNKDIHNENKNSSNNRTLHFYEDSMTSSPQFILPVTCSVAPTATLQKPTESIKNHKLRSTPHTPTSSFCKRRRGPALSKIVFNPNSQTECPTHLPTPAVATAVYREEKINNVPAVLIDVRVTVSNKTRPADHSRLGSDGTEMEESSLETSETVSMDCASTDNKAFTAPNTPAMERRKPSSLTLKLPSRLKNGHRRSASSGLADIKSSSFDLKRRLWNNMGNYRTKNNKSPEIGMESENVVSLHKTRRSASFNEQRNYYDISAPSPRSPHKFVSCNSRSPRVIRKAFNLNLRPSYPYSSRQTTEHSAPKFDCSHSLSTPTDEPLKFVVNPNGATTSDSATPIINSISPLSISSPSVDKDIGILFAQQPMSASSPATCPVTGTIPFLRSDTTPYAPHATTSSTSTSRVGYRPSMSYNPESQLTREDGRPFTLSAGCDLKPKWRKGNRRRQSCDSGYSGSQASSSFTSPTSQVISFSPCEAPIADDEVAQTESNPTNSMEGECSGKFPTVPEPSSPLPPVTHRNEIVSCS